MLDTMWQSVGCFTNVCLLSGFGCRQFLNLTTDRRGQGQAETHRYLSAGCNVTVKFRYTVKKEATVLLRWITDVSVCLLCYIRSRKERSSGASCPIGETNRGGGTDDC